MASTEDLTKTTMWSKMQKRVQTWQESDKKAGLISERELFAARCWWNDNGLYRESHELYDPALKAYIYASTDFAAQGRTPSSNGDSWSTLLRERDCCDTCGTSYSLENLSICTGCLQYVCCGHGPRSRAYYDPSTSCRRKHLDCDGTVVG